MTSTISEYRYIVSRELFFHSVLDYGYYQDNSTDNKGYLLGFYFGMGLQTKNGILKLILANGNIKNQEIDFFNTINNICYNVKFR